MTGKTAWILLVILNGTIFSGCHSGKNKNSVPNVPVVSFEQIEPLLTRENDTTYVINFWATWCSPCVKEMPLFNKLQSDFPNAKIRIILVNLDMPSQYHIRLIPFLAEHKITSEVVMLDDPDANRWINLVDPSWSGAIPATLIYNRNARLFFEKTFEGTELTNAVRSVMQRELYN